jgi:hypothetical protein
MFLCNDSSPTSKTSNTMNAISNVPNVITIYASCNPGLNRQQIAVQAGASPLFIRVTLTSSASLEDALADATPAADETVLNTIPAVAA